MHFTLFQALEDQTSNVFMAYTKFRGCIDDVLAFIKDAAINKSWLMRLIVVSLMMSWHSSRMQPSTNCDRCV
jgi:hypothetical protein